LVGEVSIIVRENPGRCVRVVLEGGRVRGECGLLLEKEYIIVTNSKVYPI
jgi:hypothetical protein